MTVLGDLIRTRRKELEITQRDLAKSIGFSNVFLQRIETGKCGLPHEYIKKTAGLIKLPAAKLRGAIEKDFKKRLKSQR